VLDFVALLRQAATNDVSAAQTALKRVARIEFAGSSTRALVLGDNMISTPTPNDTPPRFLPVTSACRHLGISRSRLYDDLAVRDPDIVIQLGERTLVDLPRLIALIAAMPRGKRKPGSGKPLPRSPGRPSRKNGGRS
jgi:hypothetical protein